MDATLAGKSKVLGDNLDECMLSELIDDAESVNEGQSTDSEGIRDLAKRILENYNARLVKVGQRAF